MMASISVGFHNGWPPPSLPRLLAEDSDIPVTSLQGAWIVSFYLVGALFGTLLVPLLSDAYGRKTALILSNIPFFVGSILIALVRSYQWLYLARFLIGVGVGISNVTGSMYIGEIAEDKLRGTLGTAMNMAGSIGIILSYCIGPWVSRQVLAVIGVLIPVICVVNSIWMPESPYFLEMKSRSVECRKQLTLLRGTTSVDKEFQEIQQNVELDQKVAGTFKELVQTPSNRRALLIAVGLMLAQGFSGFSAVTAYSSLAFRASRADLSTNVSLIVIAAVQLLGGVVATSVTKIARRRSALLISASGSVFFLSGEALYFQLQAANVDVSSIFWLPVTAMAGLILSYVVGIGVLPISIFPELFPCNVRAKGLMVIYTLGFLSGTVVTLIYERLADSFGFQYAFWFFAGTNVISGIFIYFFVPETKDRSIREIQDHLQHVTRSKSQANSNTSQTNTSVA